MTRHTILEILRKDKGYVSGETISRTLKLSRAGIWKHIEELRKEGYRIEARSGEGYRLEGIPDRLLIQEVRQGLGTNRFGVYLESYDEVPSTMDVAFQAGIKGAPEGALICAESQTQGKGRMGKIWVSPAGQGLYFSLVLRPDLTADKVARLTLLAAVAVCEALRDICGCDARIKWPNDILIGSRKVCGILTELCAEMEQVRFAVVGIGINVYGRREDLPENATSLMAESTSGALGAEVSRVKILQAVLRSFECWSDLLRQEGFDPVLTKWRELSTTLGKRVRIEEPFGSIDGIALDIDATGGLMVQNDNGVVVKRMSGDVTHI